MSQLTAAARTPTEPTVCGHCLLIYTPQISLSSFMTTHSGSCRWPRASSLRWALVGGCWVPRLYRCSRDGRWSLLFASGCPESFCGEIDKEIAGCGTTANLIYWLVYLLPVCIYAYQCDEGGFGAWFDSIVIWMQKIGENLFIDGKKRESRLTVVVKLSMILSWPS